MVRPCLAPSIQPISTAHDHGRKSGLLIPPPLWVPCAPIPHEQVRCALVTWALCAPTTTQVRVGPELIPGRPIRGSCVAIYVTRAWLPSYICDRAVPSPLLGPDVARCPSDKPFHVEFGGRRWWYVAEAVRLADDAPAADGAATRRPTTGDRVVLTADYASHGDAADGEIPAALALSQLHRSTGPSSPGIFQPLCALLTLSVALCRPAAPW